MKLDITDYNSVLSAVLKTSPDAIIHTAALANVNLSRGRLNSGLFRPFKATINVMFVFVDRCLREE